MGGETAPLVEQLRIREASGTVFDHIVPGGVMICEGGIGFDR